LREPRGLAVEIVDLYTDRGECFFGKQSPEAKYIVLGVPFDSTSSYRPGQRFAPCEIRRALYNIEWNSLVIDNATLYDIDVNDIGDVAVVHGDIITTLDRVATVIEDIIGTGKTPIVLGGEHLITYGVIRGFHRAGKKPCLIVLDAHFDLRSEYLGLQLSHATVMRRILEDMDTPLLAYVGVRAWESEEREYADARGLPYYTSLSVKRLGPVNVAASLAREASKCSEIYLSIDMDVLDPAYAPGVANPEPLGLNPFEVVQIIHRIAGDSRLAGIDLVEIAPPHDCGGITSILGAKLLLEALIANRNAR